MEGMRRHSGLPVPRQGTHKGPHTTPLHPCPYAIHDRVYSADQIPTPESRGGPLHPLFLSSPVFLHQALYARGGADFSISP